jgi:hypothetical protein
MGTLTFLWLVLMHKNKNMRVIGNSDKKITVTKFIGSHTVFKSIVTDIF